MRLSHVCDVDCQTKRMNAGAVERTMWVIVVRRRADLADHFQVVHASLAEAWVGAVTEAEARGWSKDGQPGTPR